MSEVYSARTDAEELADIEVPQSIAEYQYELAMRPLLPMLDIGNLSVPPRTIGPLERAWLMLDRY